MEKSLHQTLTFSASFLLVLYYKFLLYFCIQLKKNYDYGWLNKWLFSLELNTRLPGCQIIYAELIFHCDVSLTELGWKVGCFLRLCSACQQSVSQGCHTGVVTLIWGEVSHPIARLLPACELGGWQLTWVYLCCTAVSTSKSIGLKLWP